MKFKTLLLYVIVLLVFSQCAPPSKEESHSPRFNHVMLYVSNLDSSIAFYTKAFDIKVTNKLVQLIAILPDGSEVTRPVHMAFLKFPDQDFVFELAEHLHDSTSNKNTNLFQHVGVDVADIDAAYKRTVDAGGEILLPVRLIKANGVEAKQAFIGGPDGERIELMQIISGEF